MVNPDSIPRYADPSGDTRYAGPERTCGKCKFCHQPKSDAYCVRPLREAKDPDDEMLAEVGVSDEGCGRWERSKWA